MVLISLQVFISKVLSKATMFPVKRLILRAGWNELDTISLYPHNFLTKQGYLQFLLKQTESTAAHF